MDDLEQQLRAWAEAQGEGVAPVTADEAMAGPPGVIVPDLVAPRANRWPQTRRVAVGAAAAAVIAVVAIAIGRSDDGAPVRTIDAPSSTAPTGYTGRPGLVRFTEPSMGWTLERPAAWTVQSWANRCGHLDDSGSLITNQPDEVSRPDVAGGCAGSWQTSDLRRPGFVAVEISHHAGGPYAPGQVPDTTLPLELRSIPVLTAAGTDPELRSEALVVGGDPKSTIRVWIAQDATPADRRAAAHLVASITWETADNGSGEEAVDATGNMRSSTMLLCMVDRGYSPALSLESSGQIDGSPSAQIEWGPGDRERSTFARDHTACAAKGQVATDRFAREFSPWVQRGGPSQTPAEAARDGASIALAELPLSERISPTRWFDAAEGTWAIGRTAGDLAPDDGEVVLVSTNGHLLRSYPMPGVPPTWIHATKDAVYAGRVGDGGLPDSAIIRIDRDTLEARALWFSAPFDGGTMPDKANWGQTDGAAIGDLVHVGVDQVKPADTLVDSWIGVTGIDLTAVEALFQ